MNKGYVRRGALVRFIPRQVHVHNWSRVFKLRGDRTRWGCDSCPATTQWELDKHTADMARDLIKNASSDDLNEIFTSIGKAAEKAVKSFNKMVGAVGDIKPLPALTVDYVTLVPAGAETGELDVVKGRTGGASLGWTVDSEGKTPDELQGGYIHLPAYDSDVEFNNDFNERLEDQLAEQEANVHDADHPHADLSEPAPWTAAKLGKLKVDELRLIAQHMNINGRSKMKRVDLINAILVAQD